MSSNNRLLFFTTVAAIALWLAASGLFFGNFFTLFNMYDPKISDRHAFTFLEYGTTKFFECTDIVECVTHFNTSKSYLVTIAKLDTITDTITDTIPTYHRILTILINSTIIYGILACSIIIAVSFFSFWSITWNQPHAHFIYIAFLSLITCCILFFYFYFNELYQLYILGRMGFNQGGSICRMPLPCYDITTCHNNVDCFNLMVNMSRHDTINTNTLRIQSFDFSESVSQSWFINQISSVVLLVLMFVFGLISLALCIGYLFRDGIREEEDTALMNSSTQNLTE